MLKVTDVLKVELTLVYDAQDDEFCLTEKDYKRLLEGGEKVRFDQANVKMLKHFVGESNE